MNQILVSLKTPFINAVLQNNLVLLARSGIFKNMSDHVIP